MLPFLTIQRQRCIKFRVLRAQDFYTPLALNCQNGQRLPAPEVYIGAWKITSTSTEGQKLHENLAPVLVITSGKSLVFSRKIITSTGFCRHCAPDASAPVVVINEFPSIKISPPKNRRHKTGLWGEVRLSSLGCVAATLDRHYLPHPGACWQNGPLASTCCMSWALGRISSRDRSRQIETEKGRER